MSQLDAYRTKCPGSPLAIQLPLSSFPFLYNFGWFMGQFRVIDTYNKIYFAITILTIIAIHYHFREDFYISSTLVS